MKDEACWRTLDGRKIPIRFMTTTHIGNAMTHQTRVFDEVHPPLLEEWHRREDEGVCRKAYRAFRRVLGNYYKGSSRFTPAKKEKFNELNAGALAIQKARKRFLELLKAKPEEIKVALDDKTRVPADGGLN